jgi:hypothetical protein
MTSILGARNGNLEVLVYYLEAKQGYTVRKMNMVWYILISKSIAVPFTPWRRKGRGGIAPTHSRSRHYIG